MGPKYVLKYLSERWETKLYFCFFKFGTNFRAFLMSSGKRSMLAQKASRQYFNSYSAVTNIKIKKLIKKPYSGNKGTEELFLSH